MIYLRIDTHTKTAAFLLELMQEEINNFHSVTTNVDEQESLVIETRMEIEDFWDRLQLRLKSQFRPLHPVSGFDSLDETWQYPATAGDVFSVRSES